MINQIVFGTTLIIGMTLYTKNSLLEKDLLFLEKKMINIEKNIKESHDILRVDLKNYIKNNRYKLK